MHYYVLVVSLLLSRCAADIKEIYNTREATTDLQWTSYSTGDGWEEVSSYDPSHRKTIRSYQVCPDENDQTNSDVEIDNWIRSPYVDARDGNQIHMEVEFSIKQCVSDPTSVTSQCKETFNIFYYEVDSDVATTTFPPWREQPYVKVDTVAANSINQVNSKSFSFGPIHRKGIYLAVQDQGACMSLISIRLYYFYCHKIAKNLALFPMTISGETPASLVEVKGSCVTNARQPHVLENPMYRCNSNGLWQISTGGCVCLAGYQANMEQTRCQPCPDGTYKSTESISQCLPCPPHSGYNATLGLNPPSSTGECVCHPGYARTTTEGLEIPCTSPPSAPGDLVVTARTTHSISLSWSSPVDMGGREDLYYVLGCMSSPVGSPVELKPCPDALLPTIRHQTHVTLDGLTPHTRYELTIRASNAVSELVGQLDTSTTTIDVNTLYDAPSQVNGIEISHKQPTSVEVRWSQPAGATTIPTIYEVVLGGGAKSPHTVVKETTELSIKLGNLTSNTRYMVRVRARNPVGNGSYSQPHTFFTPPHPTIASPLYQGASGANVGIIAGVMCGVILVVITLVLVVRYRKTGHVFCYAAAKDKGHDIAMGNSLQRDPLVSERLIVALPPKDDRIYVKYPDPEAILSELKCDISNSDVVIEHIIGTGEFAEVCKGRLIRGKQTTQVAVKRLKSSSTDLDKTNFLHEAVTMAQFKHPNIVSIEGVVTRAESIMIVFEYMEHGSLDQYLQSNKELVTLISLLEMLRGIASGMNYLSSIKYIHRDLAARNILVSSDLVCKVSDFGLSRTLENDPQATYTTQGGKIAIRWTAPECIRFRQFTSASDVWSYGIVMWEVMSYGEKPYWDMSNQQVLENIQKGMRLPSPLTCPKMLHDLMLECWSTEPSDRPTFAKLLLKLDRLPALIESDATV